MAFDFSMLPRCGAKARSRNGEPCLQAVMMNGSGRCYWHGGCVSRTNSKHRRYANVNIQERRKIRMFIKQCKQNLNKS